jgi:hypothetical protein
MALVSWPALARAYPQPWRSHVRVNADTPSKAGNQRVKALGRHWPAALRTEYIEARRLLTQKSA